VTEGTTERDANGDLAACVCCGAQLRPDIAVIATTQGGLELQGWLVCTFAPCGLAHLASFGRPVERWKVSRGGRSVDTGSTRIRFEDAGPGLVERVARLPDLERALRTIAAGAADPAAVARAALEGSR
jgi:hypothetical protein